MSSPFVPSSPQTVALRPLDGGMVLDRPSNALAKNQMLELRNYIAGREGLVRRPGFAQYANNDTVSDDPVDFVVWWKTDGTQVKLLLARKLLYETSLTAGFSKVTAKYSDWESSSHSGTSVGVSGTTVTGSGTTWADDDIKAGDVMVLDADGSGDGPEEIEVSSVTSNTSLELVSTPAGTYGAGTDYDIYIGFGSAEPYLIDHATTPNEMVFFCGNAPIMTYDADNSEVDEFIADTGGAYPAGSVTKLRAATGTFLNERLFIANTYEKVSGSWTQYRQRIRWSKVGDYDDFSDATAFQDLPYFSGEILKIEALGDFLVVYAEDAVMLGRNPNIYQLPFTFQKLETGSVGILGQRAVQPWLDGHFFVGRDDVYYLGADGVPQKIGTPVIKETIRSCESPWRVYATMDPTRHRVVFGFPRDGAEAKIERMWSYEYRSQAWSYDERETWFMSNPVVSDELTWNDLSGTWTTGFDSLGDSWASLSLGEDIPSRSLYIEVGSGIARAIDAQTQDPDDVISTQVETPDYDMGDPDRTKTATRLAVRLDDAQSTDVSWTVEGSTTEGETWKSLGTLTVPSGKHEGYVNFRLSGAALRFRLTSNTVVASYAISELTLRIRARSTEFALMSQAG